MKLEKGLRPKRCSLQYYSASEQECAVSLNLSLSRTRYRHQHLEKAIKNWCALDFSTNGYQTLTYLFFYLNKMYGISAQYDIVITLKQRGLHKLQIIKNELVAPQT